MEVDWELPLILGRPFLATVAALIDVKQGKLTLRLNDEEIVFDIKQAIKSPSNLCDDTCYFIDVIDECAEHAQQEVMVKDSLERFLAQSCTKEDDDPLMQQEVVQLEAKGSKEEDEGAEIKDPSKIELKHLPNSLKYVYLENDSKPVIISSCLNAREEKLLIEVLSKHKKAIGWTISDIKGISPTTCMHKILMEDAFKPTIQPQRRLNPTLQEVVKKEVVKLLDASIIYPISDSKWDQNGSKKKSTNGDVTSIKRGKDLDKDKRNSKTKKQKLKSDGHNAMECPKKKLLDSLMDETRNSEKEVDIGPSSGSLQLLNVVQKNDATNKVMDPFKAINAEAKIVHGRAMRTTLVLGEWVGSTDFTIADLDDFNVILGLNFLCSCKAFVIPYCGAIGFMRDEGLYMYSREGTIVNKKARLFSGIQLERSLEEGANYKALEEQSSNATRTSALWQWGGM
ncbi:hypothetical protein H6P81_010427 [Aristolochia fimbriata]|uniref:Reverse transcriptase domain-containing protein n=1 Tax=Aristolochia fimbriata TaxID=158543 RepID=A0AAV7ES46_ARIFI|nr:hypothetical protein H6P81_010427 [Aristolochia fimbriata]